MGKIIEEIIAEVLRENLSELKQPPVAYEQIFLRYATIFFDKLPEKSTKVTYGLQIGLTKKYVEFILKNFIQTDKNQDWTNAESILKQITTDLLQTIPEAIENDATVYVLYRSIKTHIDAEFEHCLEICT